MEYKATVVERRDRVANLESEFNILLDEEHGDAHRPDLPDRLEHLVHDLGREFRSRLVEHQKLRAAHECTAESEHLLLSAREGARKLPAPLA